MSIVETMARAICEQTCGPYSAHAPDHEREEFYASMTEGFTPHARAALRAVKPEDVSDGMMASARIRLGLDSFDLSDETLRRAIAAAIAAGAEQ